MINEILDIFSQRGDFLLRLLWEHIQISFISVVIAIILGGIIGILISEFSKSTQVTLGIVNIIYTIPSISMLGFLIPFSGVGNITAIIALTIYGLLPMVRGTYTGIKNINPHIVEAAMGMGSTRFQILYKIKLPLAIPIILSGIRSMVTMTIALTGIASFIGAGGLGVAIYRGITINNSAMTIAGSLLIAVLALVVDILLGLIEKSLVGYRARRPQNYLKFAVAVVSIIVILFASSVITKKDHTINIATKPVTEQYIMGEMLSLLIEKETNLDVKLTHGVGGGTSNIHPSMEKGEFDLYPEYTGTGWSIVLKKEGLYTEDKFGILNQEYVDKYNMDWVGMYGFNNTYGLAVRREIADKYNLKTYSDLKNVSSELTFGAEYDFFEREDGYNSLSKTYGLNFNKTVDLDIGLKYKALENNEIDVMVIFTTDGQLSASDVVVLEDDKAFFPSYICGNVVRLEVIEKHPELLEVLKKFDNSITDDEMANMNYQVESQGKDPVDVAREFLERKGLL